ncbi:MAG: tRNA (5-methylaminomethyl-2-thiouridine)(34)-methyltransferase MnmD [Bacteroidia bacterium]|nr:tRNA (5-methylaminomethyl-2-thiouridine)(34)-methyltransferase MnmD [Bacteroidia bacterium]
MIRQIILTDDGSHTFYVPDMGEHYHSVHGALQESRHIFIKYGYGQIDGNMISVLEIGFGTGLNAFLTLLETITDNKTVYYESWEAFPISKEESGQLNYPEILGTGEEHFDKLHDAEWGAEVKITPLFTLKKVLGDIGNFHSDRLFDLVYFDAFGPDYQPELWETGVFKKIGSRMKKNSLLVTYSVKGQVRRNLRKAGFNVEKAPGPPGKREITMAYKL